MSKLGAWLVNFMRGRYGFDQLGQALSVGVVVLWIFSILFGMLSNFLGYWTAWVSTVLNWIGLVLLVLMVWRMLSRNVEKRQAENDAYLQRKAQRAERRRSGSKDIHSHGNANKNRNANKNANGNSGQQYKYLDCAFCGQKMRVPSGKGKVAVKCPSCGEKTIVNS